MQEQNDQLLKESDQVEIVDHVYGWIWQMADMRGIVPPFCVELALHDGNRFFLHSVPEKNDATQSLVMRVWDLRALDEAELRVLRDSINAECTRADLVDPTKLHPKLDFADVRLHLGNINYAIEWNDKVWPREARPQFGLIPPSRT